MNEKLNGELAGKIAEDISNLVLSNISQITADLKQAIADREEGKEFGEISCKVNFTLASANLQSFVYDLGLEWERKKKTKSEDVHGEFDPSQMQLPFEGEEEKPKRKGRKAEAEE